ncbi:basic leucine zipper 34-like, partial [Vicia villosa]|uniref:basic leucine zipper 34-like n=1 Tax=Vicia villosa TaxID=3911 RepID=UPI00273B70FC
HQNQNPSWVDEFLDFSSARRGAHRRSVSDSVVFLESPMLDDCSGKNGENENNINDDDHEFDKFDDEQFMSMFNDEIAGVHNMPPILSSSNASSPSDQNFVNNENENEMINKQEEKKESDLREMKKEEDDEKQLKNEPDEVESQCKQENSQPQNNNNNNSSSSNDRITDPKRVKRILANRQSAPRSRVRKLQYIYELERSVTSLQAEVSILSPRVAFLDHQRLLLNVDNSALKQRIAALAQDKIFKDGRLKDLILRLSFVGMHQPLQILATLVRKAILQTQLASHPVACRLMLEEKECVCDMTLNLVQPKNHQRCDDGVTDRDIFWTHRDSIKLFNMFPNVLIIGSTYKTNKYRLPLLEIIGVTSNEKTYSSGYAFLECEKEDNFAWALEVSHYKECEKSG